MKKRFSADALAVYGILLALLLLGIACFAFSGRFSDWEKRYLAKAPDNFALDDWKLNTDLETFLSDQIPFRRQLVSLNAVTQVYTGRGTELEAWPTGHTIIEKPVEGDPEKTARRVDMMRGVAGDIPCRFLIPPTAGMLRTGDMTAARAALYREESGFYDAVTAGKDFISLKESFGESAEPVFYATDHHWNDRGVYLAYLAFCRDRGLEPAGEESFARAEYGPFYGTTFSRSAYPFVKGDTLVCLEPAAHVEMAADGKETSDHLIFPEKAESYDGYEVFLDGNHGILTITNPEGERGTLMVFRDSFASSLLPYLCMHYRRVIAVDARYYPKTFRQAIAEAGEVEEILYVYSLDSLANDTSLSRKIRK